MDMTLNRRLVQRAALIALAALVLLMGVWLVARGWQTGSIPGLSGSSARLATFTEHGVDVSIRLEDSPGFGTRLTGVFTPSQPEFHLYSKDLPRDGLQGVGRPTLLELAPGGAIRATGPLTADQPEETNYVEVLQIGFPVYPAGAVSLHLPVSRAAGDAGREAELSVTYMACKGGACLPPVIDKRVRVTLPED